MCGCVGVYPTGIYVLCNANGKTAVGIDVLYKKTFILYINIWFIDGFSQIFFFFFFFPCESNTRRKDKLVNGQWHLVFEDMLSKFYNIFFSAPQSNISGFTCVVIVLLLCRHTALLRMTSHKFSNLYCCRHSSSLQLLESKEGMVRRK